MATPLGNTFVTDEQIVAQGDVFYKGKMVESLVVEFDQAKYEEFLSSGSKSPRTRVCRRVSTGSGPEVRSEALSGAAAAKGDAANCAKQDTRANVSQEARVVSGTTAVATSRAMRNTRVNVSHETRVVQISGVQLIGIQYCIFYIIIPMHITNKYVIFTPLLYIFAGTHSKGEIAN